MKVRAGAGHASSGKVLYEKHCGTCHKLHGAGPTIALATAAVDRIIDIFPANQQAQIRTQLSLVLEGVV